MKTFRYLVLLIMVGFATSCSEEFLETQPTQSMSDQTVFASAQGAMTVIDGTLRDMREFHTNHDQFGVKSIDLKTDLMGEDIVCTNHHWFGYDYKLDNNAPTYRAPKYIWSRYYIIINNMNNVLLYIDDASAADEAYRANVKAEALALRAFAYFRLIQYFQNTYIGHENDPGVPVYTEPTLEGKGRGTVQDVYNQILEDLNDAITLFDANEMARPDVSHLDGMVARGILARVSLVMNKWGDAAKYASEAYAASAGVMSREDFQGGFADAYATNWMWGLPVNDEQSTIYASWFSHVDMTIGGYAGLGYMPKYMSSVLLGKMVDGDVRKELVTPIYDEDADGNPVFVGNENYKFSAGDFNGDYVMMRPEEMLLIEAEAKARLTQEGDAKTLLDDLRANRYTGDVTTSTNTGDDLIEEILLERRIELWCEGFTLLDIKRLKKGVNRDPNDHNPTMALNMTVEPESPMFTYMIPQDEIDNNPAITEADQNPSPSSSK